jgi:diketogulonate reductase-like aldo/keto reductase
LARKHQRSAEQIFFRFLTQIGIVPLTGTTSDQHMQDDLSIFDFQIEAESASNLETVLGF